MEYNLNKKYIYLFVILYIIFLILNFNAVTVPKLIGYPFLWSLVITIIIYTIVELILAIKNKKIIEILKLIFLLIIDLFLLLFLLLSFSIACSCMAQDIGQNIFTGECKFFSESGMCCDEIMPWYYKDGCDDPIIEKELEQNFWGNQREEDLIQNYLD